MIYHFKPTYDQTTLCGELDKFIKGKESIYTVEGYAGTGKTSTLRYFILNRYPNTTVVTAFTHKAVSVISKDTGLPGKTVHSLLGLQPNMSLDYFDPHSPTFTIQGLEQISRIK